MNRVFRPSSHVIALQKYFRQNNNIPQKPLKNYIKVCYEDVKHLLKHCQIPWTKSRQNFSSSRKFQRRTNETKKLIKHQYEKAGKLLLALSKENIYVFGFCMLKAIFEVKTVDITRQFFLKLQKRHKKLKNSLFFFQYALNNICVMRTKLLTLLLTMVKVKII